jgi:hypothetical protein
MEPASDNRPAPNSSRLGRLVRTLRNLSALCLLTLSIGVLALWLRSITWFDRVDIKRDSQVSLGSAAGLLNLWTGILTLPHDSIEFRFSTGSTEEALSERGVDPDLPVLKIGYRQYGRGWVYFVPHWFIALVFALLAFALKPKPRLRFSLSDLLVLMTLSAVMVAGVAGLTRLAS